MAYIEVVKETRTFKNGSQTTVANRDLSFEVAQGSVVTILGPSGAGKSTLLNILGGMDSPTSGQILIDGADIAQYSAKQLTTYRRQDVGFVFQFYNLVPNLTARENVELASQITKDARDVDETLALVGLTDRAANFPAQLSGGEQQRVAIARAVAKNPKLLLCDEPTGALDYRTGKQVLQVIQDAAKQTQTIVIIVTHNSAIAQMGDQVIRINDAQVQSVEYNDHPTPLTEIEW
ncbi:ABC transporter ATP-binding protein [Lactiplantibacillus mudanjiangensis]|uniref:ABC-type antimicrobial peptide transport system, ATPase component [Lactobacillus plantarum JDM1] n=1 Tax=Lactiplantibacillus mudanjiangensis TaxID=1296538 RepID=A0A660DUV1_9LACO|nr:ABC transporter ATP-binding protein [Lactiplantibacillus mudanjiangensis]VDG26214.1 ABC-type antimicrobial peptide transport system, ATPase component [Lactobacillus plantarum JDM1] [Lactiplantibacillus mudanjiangensis]VDG27371.1 ABC-type antimicrobial peptide transport system, ATPase component [Lactobacillus plantarum JDM1] [Lactiplantibacillus mudanjiangensis]